MSRIGKQPISVPQGVDVSIEGQRVRVKGPKGQLEHEVPSPIQVEMADGEIRVSRPDDARENRALHGLNRTLIANMVEGVTNGFQKTLELHGTGYRAAKSGKKLVLTVGYSHPVEFDPPEGIEFDVPAANSVIVKGYDKQRVGELAANIRAVRKPEPYLGKGIRYAGERIRRKVGKTGK